MSYLLKHVSGHVLTTQMAHVYTVFTSWMGTLHLQGRSQGGPGVPATPPSARLFNQTTYNRWRKCHDDTLAIVTIWWVPSLWHSVTSPFEKSWLRPAFSSGVMRHEVMKIVVFGFEWLQQVQLTNNNVFNGGSATTTYKSTWQVTWLPYYVITKMITGTWHNPLLKMCAFDKHHYTTM